MSKHHEIKLHLKPGVGVRPGVMRKLHVGDTVRYTSPDGAARVEFAGESPFLATSVAGSSTHTLEKPGRFVFKCFITPTGSTHEVGWGPADPGAGGEHDVIPTLDAN